MKKCNITLLTGLLFLIVLMTSCGGSGTGNGGIQSVISKTPADIVKASVDDIKNQKYSDFIKNFVRKDSVVFSKQDTAKMTGLCAMAYKDAEKKQGIKEVQIIEEKIAPDGNNAIVKYKIIFNNGKDNNADAKLRKVNGDWLLVIGG